MTASGAWWALGVVAAGTLLGRRGASASTSTCPALQEVRELTQGQAARLQKVLARNMLNGWIAEGDILVPGELAAFINLAMDQHEGDDPDPSRRSQDMRLLVKALAKVKSP